MKAPIATTLQIDCSPASPSSSRLIITYPIPWRITASGSRVLSAPRASSRTARWASPTRPRIRASRRPKRAGISAFVPSDASV